MRLFFLLVAVASLGVPLAAQQNSASSKSDASAQETSAGADTAALPVSLDRIREELAKPERPLTIKIDVPADFRSNVTEQQKLDELIKSFDFRGGPVPSGGLYAYEQQRLVFNPTNNPLAQPYAAFSGGEFLTVAAESLLEHYIGGKAIGALTKAERARAEASARADVLNAIKEYCGAQPERGADQSICQNLPDSP